MSDEDLLQGEYISDEGTIYSEGRAEDPEEDMRELAEEYPISKPILITIRAKIIHEDGS